MGPTGAKPVTNSHFVGLILKDATLPLPQHGTVALLKKGFGPALLYQISEHDTRMLVDVKVPLPSDLKVRFNVFYAACHLLTFNSRISSRIYYPNSRVPFIYLSKTH